MKTLTCVTPGKLEYKETARPALNKGQAILKIKRIGVCGTDLHAFEGTQPYFNYPRVLGHELCAELVDLDGRKDFSEKDLVTIIPYFNCGECIACRRGKPNCCTSIQVCGVHIDGGMTEYLSVPSYSLVGGHGLEPDCLALIEPLAIGAHAVNRADIQPGEFVLVVGAGPIGLGTMEFARIAGGVVIAMDVVESRLDFCRKCLNVPYAINGKSGTVVEQLKEITNGDMPTVVIDATGNKNAIERSFSFMAHGARYVLVGLQKGDLQFSHPEFHKREGTLMSSRNATREDFESVIGCIRSDLINPTLYITHRVPFNNVAEQFPSWLDPAQGVIKAMIEMND
ncbi:MAG: zinc-binding alcohol dehydrogenase family protein [Bacteroidota bacterium]